MKEPIKTSAVLVYRKPEKNKSNVQILLVKHGESAKHLTNTYGLPAGRLEEGENEYDCALRELEEETGLKTSKESLKITPTIYEAELDRKDGTKKLFTMRTFICLKHEGELKSSSETSPEWVNVKNLNNFNIIGNVKAAISEGLELI